MFGPWPLSLQALPLKRFHFHIAHFLVFRFLIVCCAADALPAGALVKCDQADSFEIDSWIPVEGILDLNIVDGLDFPCIKAEKVAPVDTQKVPYLYPGVF